MKRIISIVVGITILILAAYPVSAVEPRYTNVCDVTLMFSIMESGLAEVGIYVQGDAALTQSNVTIYLEREVGASWSRVSIGTENNVWEYSTTNREFTKSFNMQLRRTGTYRAVAVFTFNGVTIETITRTAVDTY